MACPKYDFSAYNPQADAYWDSVNFKADLDSVCHISYGAMPLENIERRTRE